MELNPDLILLKDKIEGGIVNLDEFHGEFTFRASAAGYCPRLMDYELQQPMDSELDISGAMRMLMGTQLHTMWQALLTDLLGDDYTNAEKEVILTAREGLVQISIPGHPDGEINLNGTRVVYELKCVSSNSFTKVCNDDKPFAEHYEQANVYAHAMGIEWILFHYFCRDTGHSFFLLLPASALLIEDTKKKFLRRVSNLKAGVLETRPHNDPTCSPCFFCSRKDQCYEGWIDDVKKYDKIYVSPDSPEGKLVSDLQSSKTVRLLSEKVEVKVKSLVTDMMVKFKASTVCVDGTGLSSHFKLGKNQNPLVTVKEKKYDQ